MKRLVGVLIGAVITVTLLSWLFGGQEYEITEKHWECHPDQQQYQCRVSLKLKSLSDLPLRIRLGVRVVSDHSERAPTIQSDGDWILDLSPLAEVNAERAYRSDLPWSGMLVSSLALKTAE